VVVASLMNDVSAIERFVTRIQAIVAADILVEDQPVNVTSSVGIAVYPRDGLDSETLLKHADIALYQSKESGRNCYRFFSADMDVRVSQSVALEQALRRAIGTREIYMEYQPIVDLHSGKVASLEALMRWRNPLMGQIPPSEFIPIAEKSGLIVELGTIGLKEVINQIRYWIDTRVPIVPIAINVSVVQMERGDFVKLVKELTTQAGVDTKWLRFEITESAVMKEPTRFSGVLHELRKLGCQILIDDFGTGYSSLSHLDRLPVDTLKIDRAFVRDLGRLQGQSPIIDTVVNMARRLNLKTVAEGVETPEQASLLRDLGCDYAQGFLYGKPASVLKCRALLEHLQRERPLTETTVLRVLTSKLEVEA
jgi:predicted signal transduction protein with EAL and GGDEF domain